MLRFNINRGIRREGENGGTVGAPAQETAPTATETTQTSNESNSQNSVEDFSTLWQNTQSEGAATEQQGNTTPATGTAPAQTSEEVLSSHIKGLDLGSGIDMQQIASDMAGGNTESMLNAFQEIGAQTYKAALSDTNRLMTQKISEAVDAAVGKADINYKGDQVTQQMHKALPFTENPAVAPIARGVLAQVMNKDGKLSNDQAIEKVRAFFKQMGQGSANDLGIGIPSDARPGSGGFGKGSGQVVTEDVSEPEIDFVSLFNTN